MVCRRLSRFAQSVSHAFSPPHDWQAEGKERRGKALRASASRGGRKDAEARGADGSGVDDQNAEEKQRRKHIRGNRTAYGMPQVSQPTQNP